MSTCNRLDLQTLGSQPVLLKKISPITDTNNVWGEPVFSVMAVVGFIKVRLNWESGGCETGAFKKKKKINRQLF
jgi:hypothetical protein